MKYILRVYNFLLPKEKKIKMTKKTQQEEIYQLLYIIYKRKKLKSIQSCLWKNSP